MESIKKLEEQLMMNQRSSGNEKVTNGPKDDGFNLTSNKEVLHFVIYYNKDMLICGSTYFNLYIKSYMIEDVSSQSLSYILSTRSIEAFNSGILFFTGFCMQNLSTMKKVDELKEMLQKETLLRKAAEEEVSNLKSQVSQWKRAEVYF